MSFKKRRPLSNFLLEDPIQEEDVIPEDDYDGDYDDDNHEARVVGGQTTKYRWLWMLSE